MGINLCYQCFESDLLCSLNRYLTPTWLVSTDFMKRFRIQLAKGPNTILFFLCLEKEKPRAQCAPRNHTHYGMGRASVMWAPGQCCFKKSDTVSVTPKQKFPRTVLSRQEGIVVTESYNHCLTFRVIFFFSWASWLWSPCRLMRSLCNYTLDSHEKNTGGFQWCCLFQYIWNFF